MREFRDFIQISHFCKALSSKTRIDIVKLLSKNESMNMQDLANNLNLSKGAMTAHIKLLDKAEIIHVENKNGVRGIQKLCSLKDRRFLLDIAPNTSTTDNYETEIPVGSFVGSEITPTCGLSTRHKLIGHVDEPRFFDDPEHFKAEALWFGKGYVEYMVPNFYRHNHILKEIRISQEICSEAPSTREDYPSDIYFYINDVELGFWTSPGDFGLHQGIYTPDWWDFGQYGLLKTIKINNQGVFIDENKVNDKTLDSLNLQNKKAFTYKLASPKKAKNQGGLTLYGKNFGNYNQHIKVILEYEKIPIDK